MWDLLIRLFGDSEWEENHWEKRFLAFLSRHPWLYVICSFIDAIFLPHSLSSSSAPTGLFHAAILIFLIIPLMVITALLVIYL